MVSKRGQSCRRVTKALAVSVPLAVILYMYLGICSESSQQTVTPRLDYNAAEFHVDDYDVIQDNFDLKGYFFDRQRAMNYTQSTLRLIGLGSLIDLFKTRRIKVLLDESPFKDDRTVDYANCAALFDGDEEEVNNTLEVLENNSTELLHPADYVNMTADCGKFIRERNYILDSLSDEERNFPIAYSILMYTNIEQFERLLRVLYRPQNLYCVHVDIRSTVALYRAVTTIAKCFDNVYLTETRIKVVWGEMSVLEPELMCMKLLAEKNKSWKYFINLTGQEFPLKTNHELVKILTAYNGANDVQSTRKRANKDRWANMGDPPHGIIPTKGAVHVILSRGFVDYALNDSKAKDLLKWVERTTIPDETYFATLNTNPHLKVPGSYAGEPETSDLKPYMARYKIWRGGPCNGKLLRNICINGEPETSDLKPYMARYKIWRGGPCNGKLLRNICIYGVGDLPVLARQRALFANKFLLEYQPPVLDCLEELLYNRTRDEYLGNLEFDAGWYSTLDFVVNQVKVDS